MTSMTILAILTVLTSTMARWVDLSHKHGPDTMVAVPGAPKYNLTTLMEGDQFGGIYSVSKYYGTSEHAGTHMDAPLHFQQGGMSLDNIPLERTIAEGVMLDFSKEARTQREFQVTVKELQEWEERHGEIPRDAAILFNFGWSSKFRNEALYKGTRDLNNFFSFSYPYVTEEAGKWLYYNRNARMLGTDALTVDPVGINGKPSTFPLHRLYLRNNRFIIENLKDLDQLPAKGFRFHTAPVKFVGSTGAQVRAYAMVGDEMERNGGHVPIVFSLLTVFVTTFCCAFIYI